MFKPKGAEPQWQAIYEYISTMEIGDVVKDEELAGLLPDAPEGSIRSAFYRAVKEVEDNRSRTFGRVRNIGYRMVEATEHEGLARGQHKKAKRRLVAAGRKLRSADRSRLSPEQRKRFDSLEDHVSQQRAMIRRLDERVSSTETGLKAVRRNQKEDAAELSRRLDSVTDLLRRHGISAEAAEVPTTP